MKTTVEVLNFILLTACRAISVAAMVSLWMGTLNRKLHSTSRKSETRGEFIHHRMYHSMHQIRRLNNNNFDSIIS